MTDVSGGEVLVYEDTDGRVRVDVRLDQETVWLSLTQMAKLFGCDESVVSRYPHLRNVFQSGELERQATIATNATVQPEGGREVVREIEYFNLDAILSVGYRVNSKRGTHRSDQAAYARSVGRVAEGPAINALCHAPCSK
jgi:hypothetical protein